MDEKRERITAEITALKSLLTESDYQLIKMLENLAGCTSILDILAVFKSFLTDFGELVNDRKTWRENINTLEAELEQLDTETALENKVAELRELPSTFGIGVMMFDLNNLKHVNDTYGHEKGDEFIQAFAYCLTRILDSNSFLARYGGDEFIIIQTDTDSEHLKQMQHRLANLVHDYNNQATLPLSYATGYEISQQNHYFMMEDLINAAD